ncbi:MAG TPA: trypsin-like peptidase domain-containing protein [Fimbriimonadaceae bacterium]|nr:trypsin-like peptidase domain-containing protein [Fimbriimonadaceae bacterium]
MNISAPRPTRPPRGLRSILCVAIALLCSACGTPSENVPLSDTSVASLGKSATVLIVNHISAQVTVPKFTFDIPAIVAMGQRIVTPDMTREQLMSAVWTAVFQNPADYLQTSDGDPETKTAVAVGSGFFVTSDGVLVTNAHVVEAEDDQLKTEFTTEGLKDKLPGIIDDAIGQLSDEDQQYTKTWLSDDTNGKLAMQGLVAFLAPKTEVTDATANLGVVDVSGEAGTLQNPQLMPAHTLPGGVGSSQNEDVAILKVDGADFHTLPLSADVPQIQDTVFAVGFPGDSTFNDTFDQNERPESTVTDGKVNAIKTMSNFAYSAIQMSATIHPGNSGGPVLDRMGRVVGISTFGLTDSEGNAIPGTNFAIPISVAKKYLSQAGVTPSESSSTFHYRRALISEQTNHFSKARTEVEAILKDRPTDAIALREADHLNHEISEGHDRNLMDYLPAAAGGGAFLVLVAGLGVAGMRKRRRRSAAPAGVEAPTPAPVGTPRYRLLIQGRMIPLTQGASLATGDLPFLKSMGTGTVATVVQHLSQTGTIGIRNDSSDSWEVTWPDGTSLIVAPSETVPLIAGLRISFGPAQGVVHG